MAGPSCDGVVLQFSGRLRAQALEIRLRGGDDSVCRARPGGDRCCRVGPVSYADDCRGGACTTDAIPAATLHVFAVRGSARHPGAGQLSRLGTALAGNSYHGVMGESARRLYHRRRNARHLCGRRGRPGLAGGAWLGARLAAWIPRPGGHARHTAFAVWHRQLAGRVERGAHQRSQHHLPGLEAAGPGDD